jgi:hypothetical protein
MNLQRNFPAAIAGGRASYSGSVGRLCDHQAAFRRSKHYLEEAGGGVVVPFWAEGAVAFESAGFGVV